MTTWKKLQKAKTKNAGLLTKKYVLELVKKQLDETHNKKQAKQHLKSFTGKIIFSEVEYESMDLAFFFCGPEDDGHLSDGPNVDGFLKQIFKDFKNTIEIGSTDNQHVIDLAELAKIKDFPTDRDVAVKQIRELVSKRLKEAGAIPFVSDEEE